MYLLALATMWRLAMVCMSVQVFEMVSAGA